MNRMALIGIVLCMLLIANGSVAVGTTRDTSCEKGTTLSPNLAPNPSFEEGDTMPTGWSPAPNSTGVYTWDSSYALSGEKSVGVFNLTDFYPYEVMWRTTDFIPVDLSVNSYIQSVWFKFVEVPPQYQYAMMHILEYNENYQLTGAHGHGNGAVDTEWHQMWAYTGNNNDTKFVKLEIGQAFNPEGDVDSLIEIRYDDIYFGIWNTIPNDPSIIGEMHGRIRSLYDYTFTTSDPDSDNVSFEIAWGDNTTQTTGVYHSGENAVITHIWGIEGTYNISVRATDEHGAKSKWTTVTVTMPFSYSIPFFRFWNRILERFPHAFPVLRHLMEN